MDISIITDKNGDTIKAKHYDGINYFLSGTEGRDIEVMLSEIMNYVSRQDDVIIATYPKSGTTWVHCVVYMLLTNKTEYPEFTDCINDLSTEEYASMLSPRLVDSHFLFKYFPTDIVEKRAKIINVLRNPKDTAVSMYCFLLKMKEEGYKGSWDAYLDLFLSGKSLMGSWFQYVKDWEDAKLKYPECILQIRYEDLVMDLCGNIKKIADFINVPCDEKFLNEVAEKCKFENMKHSDVSKDFWKIHTVDGQIPIWRKGVVGDWKNWFTVSQNEKFNKCLQREMGEYSIQFRYE